MTKILVVDDEPEMAELMSLKLGRHGLTCVCVGTAEEAVEAAGRLRPDLILMDMHMPRRRGGPEDPDGGYWAVGQIAAAPFTRHIPIIAVTGFTEPEKVERYRSAGCVDVVTKPADYDLLRERIAQLTGAANDASTRNAGLQGEVGRFAAATSVARHDAAVLDDGAASNTVAASSKQSAPPEPCPPFPLKTSDSSVEKLIESLTSDERRRELTIEHPEYGARLVEVKSAAVRFLARAAKAPADEAERSEWSHDLVNDFCRVQARLSKVRTIEKDTLFDGMDDWADRLELGLAKVLARIRESGPQDQAADAAPDTSGPPAPMRPSVSADPAVRTILLADDNPEVRGLVAGMLRKDGHEVAEVEDGCAVMNWLGEHGRADLIILDVNMPRLSGMDVLERIKKDDRLKRLPVLLFSGIGEDHLVIEALRKGAEDYLTKPVKEKLLQVRVNAILERESRRRELLAGFFSPEVIAAIEENPGLLTEAQAGVDVTILVCDIRGFSAVTERLRGSTAMLRWLNEVMTELTRCVHEHGGTVVDYIGDELLAMWGAPQPQSDHAARACAAAAAMVRALPALNDAWRGTIGGDFAFGIGLNSGPVHVGNTGSAKRFKYGPLGNTVNVASRVQGATKYMRTGVVLTGETHAKL
ncbi:MAG TPA: response regulator, partial [Planctomycetaceae bacterium]